MMSIRRIVAIIFTHQHKFTNKTDWIELLYWWASSTLVVGFIGKAIAAATDNALLSTMTIVMITAVRPAMRGCATTMAQLLVDTLSGRIFLATMSTPVTAIEVTVAYGTVAATLGLIRVAMGYALLFLFFDVNPLVLGWVTVWIIPFLLLAGLTLGLFISAIVYITGKQSHRQLQVIGESLVAICGAYAPVSALPHVFQTISWCIPVTYVFEGIRASVLHGLPIWPFLCKSVLLAIPYAVLGALLLYWAFRRAKNNGLAELEAR